MLYDRDYMSDNRGGRPPFALILIGVLVVCFLVQSAFTFYGNAAVTRHLGLTREGLFSGHVWLLGTYQFLHQTPWPWHLIGNCLGLFFIGTHIEEMYGARRLLWLHFGGGLAGGLLHVVIGLLPAHQDIAVVGASAGVLSLLAAYATAFPEKQLTTFLYFIPVTLKAKWILWFFTGLAVFGSLFPYDSVAHGAHLGGIAFGFLYVKLGGLSEFGGGIGSRISEWWQALRVPMSKPQRRAAPPSRVRVEPAPRREAASESDFIAREVDPILEKIAQHGIQSLTPAERQTLEAARQKVNRR
jgi:membrane associated rhomboid family serine protease